MKDLNKLEIIMRIRKMGNYAHMDFESDREYTFWNRILSLAYLHVNNIDVLSEASNSVFGVVGISLEFEKRESTIEGYEEYLVTIKKPEGSEINLEAPEPPKDGKNFTQLN